MIKRIYLEIAIALFLIVICLFGLIFEVSTYTGSSAIMPYGVLVLATFLSIFWLVQSFFQLRNDLFQSSNLTTNILEIKKFCLFVCIVLIYVIGILLIGFFSTTVIIIPIISIGMGYRNKKGIFLTTILFTSVIFIVFKLFLKIPLPLEIWNRLIGA